MTPRPCLLLLPLASLLLVAPHAASQGAAKPASSKPVTPGKPTEAVPQVKAPAPSKPKAGDARSVEYAQSLAPLETKASANGQAAVALSARVKPLADERRQVQAKIDALKQPLAVDLRKADAAAAAYDKAQQANRAGRGPAPSPALLASARADYAAAQAKVSEAKALLTRLQAIEAQLNEAALSAATLDAQSSALERDLTPARTRWRTLTSELDTLSRTAIAASGRALENSGHARPPAARQRLAELEKASAQLTADLAEASSSLAAVEKSAKDAGASAKQEAKPTSVPGSKPAKVAVKEAKRDAK